MERTVCRRGSYPFCKMCKLVHKPVKKITKKQAGELGEKIVSKIDWSKIPIPW